MDKHSQWLRSADAVENVYNPSPVITSTGIVSNVFHLEPTTRHTSLDALPNRLAYL